MNAEPWSTAVPSSKGLRRLIWVMTKSIVHMQRFVEIQAL